MTQALNKHDWRQAIDAIGTARRIRALQRIGYALRETGRLAGYRPNVIEGYARHPRIMPQVAQIFDRVYQEHKDQPRWGVTSLRAEQFGYPGPWNWRGIDMDDPTAQPNMRALNPWDYVDRVKVDRAVWEVLYDDRDRHLRALHPAEVVQTVRRLVESGASREEIERRMPAFVPTKTIRAITRGRDHGDQG